MLKDNEKTLGNIIDLFNHSNLTFTHPKTSQALKIIEENMATLDLSNQSANPPVELCAAATVQPMDVVDSGMSIGARIMRQFRRNRTSFSPSSASVTARDEQPNNDLYKKKNSNSKAIEKLYLKKTLGRLKHTQLETIFEHDGETDTNENYTLEPTKVFGKRKIKRSMSCSDGFNTTKTLKQKRKNRIRKIFGVHKKIKSISMKKFLEHLQVTDPVDLITPMPLPAISNGA